MRKLFFCLILLLPGLSVPAQTPSRTVEDPFLLATAVYAEGQYAEAKQLLLPLHAADPADDAVNYYLGMCELILGELDAAEQHLGAAEKADPGNEWYVYAMASLYDARMDHVRSGEYVEKLVKMNPSQYNNPNTLSVIADAKMSVRQDSLALAYYNQALELDPTYAPAQFGRMDVQRMRGNYPAFFVGLEEFIRNPEARASVKSQYLTALMDNIDSRFYWVYGDTINRLVDVDLELHPDDYAIQLLKLRMLYIKKDWEGVLARCEVMEALSRAEGNDEHIAEALSIAGDVYYQEFQDKKKAYAAYVKALEADPDRTSVLNNYAYYLSLEKRQLRKALKMSRRTVELEPDNATYLDTYGWILYLLKRPQEAKPYFKHAMLYGGRDSAVILKHYSKVLGALGEQDLSDYYKGLSEQKKQ